MDDHIQLIERVRARATHARAVRQHRTSQKNAALLERERKRQKAVKVASLLSVAESPLTSLEGHASQVELPKSVLELVMSHIAQSLEPGGVIGPSIVAKNLANAALVCSEFYLAARYGFTTLNRLVETSLSQHLHKQALPPRPSEFLSATMRQQHAEAAILAQGRDLPGPKWDWQFWDCVITYPMTVSLPEIWKAAEHLGVPLPVPQNHVEQQQHLAAAAAANANGHAQGPHQQQQHLAATATAAAAAAAGGNADGNAQGPQQQQQEFIPQLTKKQHQRLVANILAAFGLQRPRPAAAVAAAAGPDSQDPQAAAAANSSQSSAAAAAGAGSCAGAHAALLHAVLLERCCPAVAWDGPDQCQTLRNTVSELSSLKSKVVLKAQHYNGTRACLAKIRQELLAAGVQDLQQLQSLLATEKQKAEQARLQQQQQHEIQQQQQQQSPRPAAAQRSKGFSLGSIVIKPRHKKNYNIIT